jgi:hypothetical protein
MKSPRSVQDNPQSQSDRPSGATSASVLDLWENGMDMRDSCAAAVGRLIVAQPERASTFADPAILESALRSALAEELADTNPEPSSTWLPAIAEFLDLQGRVQEAVDIYREALNRVKVACGCEGSETRAVAAGIDRLLRRLGREEEARAIARELRLEPLMGRRDHDSLLALRDAAFSALAAGSLPEAETIYRYLLTQNFEPSGTHCHLARVLLAGGQDADATAAISAAWECRNSSVESYIVARILFLQALLATLAGQDAQSPLTTLKDLLLHDPAARHSWLIAPVLSRVQTRLTPRSHEFFVSLAQEMSGGSVE